MEQSVQLLIAMLVCVVGLILIVPAVMRAIKAKQTLGIETDVQHKDGLPITPRDERMPQTTAIPLPHDDDTDALSSMAAVAASSPVVNADKTPEPAPIKVQTVPVMPSQAPIHTDSHADEQVHDLDTTDVEHETAVQQTEQEPQEQAATAISTAYDNASPSSEQKAPLLDRHLSQEVSSDQNNEPLLNAEETVTIVITPRNVFTGLSGKNILGLVREYGLKYGVMDMFHRYEHENGTGDLWFSMLGANDTGVQSFDLNTLSESRFNSILLFLSLPHPYALRGFDSMVSIAQMIAADIDANLYDEQGELLDDAAFAKMRANIANYQ